MFYNKAGIVIYGEKPVNISLPPWPLHELLPPASCPDGVPDLNDFDKEFYMEL